MAGSAGRQVSWWWDPWSVVWLRASRRSKRLESSAHEHQAVRHATKNCWMAAGGAAGYAAAMSTLQLSCRCHILAGRVPGGVATSNAAKRGQDTLPKVPARSCPRRLVAGCAAGRTAAPTSHGGHFTLRQIGIVNSVICFWQFSIIRAAQLKYSQGADKYLGTVNRTWPFQRDSGCSCTRHDT